MLGLGTAPALSLDFSDLCVHNYCCSVDMHACCFLLYWPKPVKKEKMVLFVLTQAIVDVCTLLTA